MRRLEPEIVDEADDSPAFNTQTVRLSFYSSLPLSTL